MQELDYLPLKSDFLVYETKNLSKLFKTLSNPLFVPLTLENAIKCFERLLDFVALTYFGPPSSTGPIIRRVDAQNGISAGELLIGDSEMNQTPSLHALNPED
jgi:hypothetical protein